MCTVSHRKVVRKCLLRGLATTFLIGAVYQCVIYASMVAVRGDVESTTRSVRRPVEPCISYRYEDPSGRNVTTRPFGVNCSLLSEIGFPITDFSHASVSEPDSFVFATAADDRYFHVGMDAIARVQAFFPKVTIYFWDLGENRRAEHVQKLSRLCNVMYRKFNFTQYPKFVRELRTYSWKVIILHEMLHDHPNIFWIDSSIRLQSGDFKQSVHQATNSSRGVLMFSRTYHSILATTYKTMFEYLPIEVKHSTRILMLEANSIYIQLSEQLYKHFIRWWLLCALDEMCMAPTRDLYCKFKQGNSTDHYARYAKCHRYDQSAINILLANYFDYDEGRYQSRAPMLTVERGSHGRETLNACLMNGSTMAIKSKQYFV